MSRGRRGTVCHAYTTRRSSLLVAIAVLTRRAVAAHDSIFATHRMARGNRYSIQRILIILQMFVLSASFLTRTYNISQARLLHLIYFSVACVSKLHCFVT